MKIAIYGGAFNPVHLGHIEIVEHLNNKTDFDKILIIPSKFSPHKSNENLVDDAHRFEMCKLAFEKFDKCEVSNIELKRDEISYTINTLLQLKETYCDDELFLVCGSDMFLSLLNWRQPEDILKLVSIYAFVREDEKEDIMLEQKHILENMGTKVEISKIKVLPFSSTEVRNAIKNSDDYSSFLSKEVYDYIIENNLYK